MRSILLCGLVLLSAPIARAELRPDEIGIVAMATSRESRYLAEYYAKSRDVPASNVFLLSGNPGAGVSRLVWEEDMRPEIRAWLFQDGRDRKIRCLVTCWDVPEKIRARSDRDAEVIARTAFLQRERAKWVGRFGEALGIIDAIAPGESLPSRVGPKPDASLRELSAQFDVAMAAAQKRMQALSADDDKKQAQALLQRAILASGGLGMMVNVASRSRESGDMSANAALRLELTKAELAGLQKGAQSLAALPDTVARDTQILNLLQLIGGSIGVVRWIDEQAALLKKNETHASFDSELSLVLWPEYPLFLFSSNLLHYKYDGRPGKRPTLMVSRLAAPTLELATKMIDTSLAVESQGLSGKVYLDSRGTRYDPKTDQALSYGRFDESLRQLAKRLEETSLEVVLDKDPQLFKPGSCPDAALYCGWYSLARYVDAFDWKPGAVAYHMASLEAAQIRVPGSSMWCPAMLEDGVTATLGPTAEPYLAAFPLPDDFFSLLLTGKYTLVEAYYRTKPFNSWQMILLGDPLYNPFKKNPVLRESALPEELRPHQAPGGGAR